VAIEEKLNEPDKQLLRQAYDSAVKFIEAKAGSEECHGGSGITAWIIGSEIDQKNAYLKMVADVQEGFEPKPKDDFPKSDKILNDTYQTAIQKMKVMDPPSPYLPTIDQVREIERLWITYRDASVKLFMAINPSVDEAVWKSWLTEIRTGQLKELLENIDMYSKI